MQGPGLEGTSSAARHQPGFHCKGHSDDGPRCLESARSDSAILGRGGGEGRGIVRSRKLWTLKGAAASALSCQRHLSRPALRASHLTWQVNALITYHPSACSEWRGACSTPWSPTVSLVGSHEAQPATPRLQKTTAVHMPHLLPSTRRHTFPMLRLVA